MWEYQRVSSLSEKAKLKLNEDNHISNFKDKILEIYGIKVEEGGKTFGEEHSILGWSDDKVLKDKEGNLMDIVVHYNDGIIIWEPYVEYLLRKIILDRGKVSKYEQGYFGNPREPGYKMWIKIN